MWACLRSVHCPAWHTRQWENAGLTAGVVAAAGTGAACLSVPSASYHHTLSMSWIMTAHQAAEARRVGALHRKEV